MSKYYYWLIIHDPNLGYCGSNICVSSPKAIHEFVLSHIDYLPNHSEDYIFYGYERTSIQPDDFIHMPFQDHDFSRARFFYKLHKVSLVRERLN